MKKLTTILAALFLFIGANAVKANTNPYQVDNNQIDALINNATDVSSDLTADYSALTFNANVGEGEKTVGGFLLRSFFCGFIALHRSYMGTGGKQLLWYYLCIPVASGVVNCVDFWWVVFKGKEAMDKFKDNPKWIVWND